MDFCGRLWTFGESYGLLRSIMYFSGELWTSAVEYGLLGGSIDFRS